MTSCIDSNNTTHGDQMNCDGTGLMSPWWGHLSLCQEGHGSHRIWGSDLYHPRTRQISTEMHTIF